jgi:EmrB/QacA subfamily drug resistance transporter
MTQLTGDAEAPEDGDQVARRRAVFLVTAMGAFMASLDLSIVNVAFPALERTFAADSRATLAWVITGYSIVFGSLLVVAGRTADRVGSRRVFFAGLGVFTLGSLLCGIAPSVELLVAGRLVQGLGAAALLPSSLALLLGAYPGERRSQMVALWGGIGALAVATGPSVGALLITGFGWRAAFFVNLPVGLVAWLVGRRVLEGSPRGASRAAPDYLGVALLGGALASLVLAISQGPSWGWTSPPVIGSLGATAVLAAIFLVRSSRHPEPVLDLQLFHSRSFSVANLATVLYDMGFFAMLLGNILFLTSVWGYSILIAGLAVTPGPLVVAVVSGPAGKLAGRIGFRPVLLAGFAVFASGLAWYALRIGVQREYLTVWLPGTLVVGLGIGLTFPVLSATAVSSLHHERFAVGSAVNQTARQVGGALGVALLVVILGTPSSPAQALGAFHHLWWFAVATALSSGVVCLFLGTKRRAEATAETGPSTPDVAQAPAPVVTGTAPGGNGIDPIEAGPLSVLEESA